MRDDTPQQDISTAAAQMLHLREYYVQHPNIYFPNVLVDGCFIPAKERRTLITPPDEFYSNEYWTPSVNLVFDVLQAGSSVWQCGDRYTRTKSAVFAVELVTHGRGELRVGQQKRYALQPGDVFILHPDERHTYRACSREPFKKLFVTLATTTITRAMLAATPLGQISHLRLAPDMAAQVEEVMKRITSILRAGGEDTPFTASLAACELITMLLRVVNRHGTVPHPNPRLQPVMTYAINHISEQLSVRELAHVAKMSGGHLNRLFVKAVGMRAHEWLTKLRMRFAAELLYKTNMPIHIISEHVGYENTYAFSRAFKHVTGIAPVTYRRRARKAR